MYLLKTRTHKIIFKLIAFVLIQAFLLFELAWAQGSGFLNTPQEDTLSPKVLINSVGLQNIFSVKEEIFKGQTAPLPKLTYDGTSGIRGPAEELEATAAYLATALTKLAKTQNVKEIHIGYDTRESSPRIAKTVASILALGGIKVIYLNSPVASPMIADFIALANKGKPQDCIAGVMITGSHNPSGDNGFAPRISNGAIMIEGIDDIYREFIRLWQRQQIEVSEEEFIRQVEKENIILINNPRDIYLKEVINKNPIIKFVWARIKDMGIDTKKTKIIYDPMKGVGAYIVPHILAKEFGFDIKVTDGEGNIVDDFLNYKPMIQKTDRKPYPNRKMIGYWQKLMAETGIDFVLSNDGDSDRFALAEGDFIDWNQLFILLIDYLGRAKIIEKLGYTHIVSTHSTTAALNNAAEKYGLKVENVPVGFKYVSQRIQELKSDGKKVLGGFEGNGGLVLCFEEGGIDKDGIIADILFSLIKAECQHQGMSLKDMIKQAHRHIGLEEDFGYMQELVIPYKEEYASYVEALKLKQGEFLGKKIDTENSVIINPDKPSEKQHRKIVFEDGSWIIVRPSGTEGNKARIYAEAKNKLSCDELVSRVLEDFLNATNYELHDKAVGYLREWLGFRYSYMMSLKMAKTAREKNWDKLRQLFYVGSGKTTTESSLTFEADNFQQGYEKLSTLISNISDKKQPILCIEGDVSAGKSTFVGLIKEIGIGNISPENILFISIDDIINDLLELGELSLFEVILEMPLEINALMSQASDNIDLIVVEGSESLDYMKEADFKPDIIAILKASKRTRFIRHLMKHGLFAFKFFHEPYGAGQIPNDIPVLYINNELSRNMSFLSIAIRMLAKTLEIIVTKALGFIVPDFLDSLASTYLSRMHKGFSFLDLIILPLKAFSYLINRIVDLYFILKSERNMISIIKQRFKGNIRVLDVGTADGSFVENFQGLLDKKGVKAEVYGIDINPARIARGLHLSRNIKVMDVKDAQTHFGQENFDIITINAPDRPAEYLISQSMPLLKPDGILILRLHKGAHYDSFFGPYYREKLIEKLSVSYKVTSLKKHIYHLPNGDWYKLQPPIIISAKDMQADMGRLLEAADAYLEKAQLDEALTLYKRIIKVKQKKITDLLRRHILNLKLELITELKDRAYKHLVLKQYKLALADYGHISDIEPEAKFINNYFIGGIKALQNNMHAAVANFQRAYQDKESRNLYELSALLVESIITAENIRSTKNKPVEFKRQIERFEELSTKIQVRLTEQDEQIDNFLIKHLEPAFYIYNHLIDKYKQAVKLVQNLRPKHTDMDNDFHNLLQQRAVKIPQLLRDDDLNEAFLEFKRLKERGISLPGAHQHKLLEALKNRADLYLLSKIYNKAWEYYSRILIIAPHETDAYFYIGAVSFMQDDLEKAYLDFKKAQQGEQYSAMFALACLIVENIKLSRKIRAYLDASTSYVEAQQRGLTSQDIDEYRRTLNRIGYIFERYDEIEDFAIDNGLAESLIFISLSSAFGSEEHQFTNTLKKYGFQPDVYESVLTENLERLSQDLIKVKVVDLKKVRALIAKKKGIQEPESDLKITSLSPNLYQLIGQSI